MSYNYSQLFDQIIASVCSGGSITARMHAVIRECARQKPHIDWERMLQIDFEVDAPRLTGWMSSALSNSDNATAPQGIWFGLFNPSVNEVASADAYVCVAPKYDANSFDWASEIEQPHAGSYLNSVVLQEIYSCAYLGDAGLGNDAEHLLVLAYGGIVAHTALSEYSLPSALHSLRGAAVGFDDGDFLVLGEISEGNYRAHVRAG